MASLIRSTSSNKEKSKGVSSFAAAYSRDIVTKMMELGWISKDEVTPSIKEYGSVFSELMGEKK